MSTNSIKKKNTSKSKKEFYIKLKGTLWSLFGVVLIIIATFGFLKSGLTAIVPIILMASGITMFFYGNYIFNKSKHVTWTREAIERDRHLSGKEMKCPQCKEWNTKKQNFCSNCSLPLTTKCPKCDKENNRENKFCGNCGTLI